MFVAKALEDTLRRVVLLTVNRSVLLQNTVDDIREGGQFRAFRWLASPISGGSECRSIFLTVARAMPNRLAASRWLRPSTWQASRTRRYRSTVYILPPSISKKDRRLQVAEFYSARGWEIPPLPWTNLSPPFSHFVFRAGTATASTRINTLAASSSARFPSTRAGWWCPALESSCVAASNPLTVSITCPIPVATSSNRALSESRQRSLIARSTGYNPAIGAGTGRVAPRVAVRQWFQRILARERRRARTTRKRRDNDWNMCRSCDGDCFMPRFSGPYDARARRSRRRCEGRAHRREWRRRR